MTSNIGSSVLLDNPGADDNREKVMELVRHHFRPEFINRVDEILFFHSLDEEHLREIVSIQIANFAKRLEESNIGCSITKEAEAYLAKAGFDPVYGARPLKRIITREVETPISRMLVSGKIKEGDTVNISLKDGTLYFS
jgi:ATP-dependent Clp protease ATP-binding subunit ClpB